MISGFFRRGWNNEFYVDFYVVKLISEMNCSKRSIGVPFTPVFLLFRKGYTHSYLF